MSTSVPHEKPGPMFRIEAEPTEDIERIMIEHHASFDGTGFAHWCASCGVEWPCPDYRLAAARLEKSTATDARAKLTAALDLLADVSYHEASLPPRVQRAVRAAHRAVARAAQRAGDR